MDQQSLPAGSNGSRCNLGADTEHMGTSRIEILWMCEVLLSSAENMGLATRYSLSLKNAAGNPFDDLALKDQGKNEYRYRRQDGHRGHVSP